MRGKKESSRFLDFIDQPILTISMSSKYSKKLCLKTYEKRNKGRHQISASGPHMHVYLCSWLHKPTWIHTCVTHSFLSLFHSLFSFISLFLLPYPSFFSFLRYIIMYHWLASKLLWSWEWPWTTDPPALTFQLVRFQACTTMQDNAGLQIKPRDPGMIDVHSIDTG